MNATNLSPEHRIVDFASISDELPLWSAPFGLKMLDAVRYRKNMQVLDIGCGTGFPLLELAARLGSTSRVFGIDPWGDAIKRAQLKAEGYGLSNVHLIEGYAEQIPLPDKSTDLIVSNNGLNNVDDPDRVLLECARVAKPGAQFLLTMNLKTTMLEFYSTLETVLREEMCTKAIEEMHRHIYKKRRPLEEVRESLESSGFTVVRIENGEFAYRFADATAMFEHPLIRLWFLDPWREIVSPERRPEVFQTIESRLNSRAETEGSCVLTIPYVLIESSKT